MTLTLNNRTDLVEPAARLLAGAIDTGDGGTEEQRQILHSIVHGIWQRPDIDVSALAPLDLDEAEMFRSDKIVHRRLRMLLVLLEFCRHPLTPAQVERTDAVAAAIGEEGDAALELARGSVGRHRDEAVEHFMLVWESSKIELSETVLLERLDRIGDVDPELVALLRGYRDLPRGTLGREYLEFYMEYKFQLPGDGVESPAFFVAHDMTHLIAGYGPSAPEELALSAMQLAMNDSDEHWMVFVTGLAAYELGVLSGDDFVPKEAVLARDGAIDLLFEAFERGSQCSGDFSIADHLSMAHLPISRIREMYSVPPPTVPFPPYIS